MIDLKYYLEDGANYQAQAVLAFLKRDADIRDSWNDETKRYDATIKVARWHNLREQGYVVYLSSNGRQLNIAFFEHRNSDSIHAVRWEQVNNNPLTIENADFGGVYTTKYDTSHSVGYGDIPEMAEWIINEFKVFWSETNPKTE
jgi:hypothetical protein